MGYIKIGYSCYNGGQGSANYIPEVTKMIQISEKAAQKLKDVLAEQKKPEDTMLRVSFGGFG